jgi:hypothetical protein
LIDKLPDSASLALGALVFAQFVDDRPFSIEMAVLRVLVWAVFLGVALVLGRGARI